MDSEMQRVLRYLARYFSQAGTNRLDTPFSVSDLDFPEQIAPALQRLANASPPYITGITVAEANYPVVITGLTERGWDEVKRGWDEVKDISSAEPFVNRPGSLITEDSKNASDQESVEPRSSEEDAESVVKALLDLRTAQSPKDADATIRMALKWVEVHQSTPQAAAVLEALLKRRDLSPEYTDATIRMAGSWVEVHRSAPRAAAVLEALLKRRDLSPEYTDATIRIALYWVEDHQSLRGAAAVLQALLNRPDLSPGDADATIKIALSWVEVHKSLRGAPAVLQALLNRRDLSPEYTDATIKMALKWVEVHQSTPQAAAVLETLLKRPDLSSDDTDESVGMALRWVNAHPSSRRSDTLLTTMLDREGLPPDTNRSILELMHTVRVSKRADSSVAQDDESIVEDQEPLNVDAGPLVIPAITDDAVEGYPDRLGIDADARALAALVASQHLEPPLAIGIYGAWGSGKTFFMKRVQTAITDLATDHAHDTFYPGVAHVWFSAWHYAEGNLWASLLHHIFASLHPTESQHRLALDQLMAKVEGAKQLTLAVEANVKAATTRLDVVNKEIKEAKTRHQKAIQESSKLRTKDLWDTVKLSAADQGLKDQVAEAADDLGLSVATGSARDLMGASRQVIDLASRIRVLATAKPRYRSPLAYALYAAIIVAVLGLLIGASVHMSNEWMGTAITVIAQFAAVGSAVAAWVSRQAGLIRRFIAPAETLQQRLQQRLAQEQAENERELAKLKQEADTAEAELAAALQQHTTAEQQLATAQKEQAELTGKRLLRRYLAERAGSSDYEDYMGVIALAHRDLRDLDEHLRAAVNDNEGTEQGLDRIVLYIDDLDRCDPELVANVLDAVHLLLALRLFVVIVGVDPHWLERSLRDRHPILLKSLSSDVPWTSPTDYLEKIFQLTYTLPHMSPSSCADLLVAAAQNTQVSSTPQYEVREDKAQYEVREDKDSYDVDISPQDADSGLGGDFFTSTDDTAEYLAEALILTKDDIEALRTVAPLVSTSPRRAKRFLNVYLVIRARASGDPALREHLHNIEDSSTASTEGSLLVFVALLTGLPKTMGMFGRDMEAFENKQDLTVATLLANAATPEEQTRAQKFLASAAPPVKALPMRAFRRWLPITRPYLPLSLKEPQQPLPADATP